MDILLIVQLSIILIVAITWGLMVTFFWWELIQLRKVRHYMSTYPDKLHEAIEFMEKVGEVSNELKRETLPTITAATGDVRMLGGDIKAALNELIKLTELARTKPAWVETVINTVDARFDARLKQVAETIRRLREE
ncbi:hypothetical protein HY793_02515 [Candidatus Desantisbacteria bacterium]|nr:hypothetical protein [Candidatus Desantisbacteria bacterium]